MIDIESELYTEIYEVLSGALPSVSVSGNYVLAPTSLPHVTVVQSDNQTYAPTVDSSGLENHAECMFEVQAYDTSKTVCKAIVENVDAVFHRWGFERIACLPIQNLNDPNIYRMVARYRAVVSRIYEVSRR